MLLAAQQRVKMVWEININFCEDFFIRYPLKRLFIGYPKKCQLQGISSDRKTSLTVPAIDFFPSLFCLFLFLKKFFLNIAATKIPRISSLVVVFLFALERFCLFVSWFKLIKKIEKKVMKINFISCLMWPYCASMSLKKCTWIKN